MSEQEAPAQPAVPLPILLPGQVYGNELAGVNSSLFSGGAGGKSPEYLSYQPRGCLERMVYNTGISYLAGVGGGGTYGLFHGMMNSPSPRLRIRINSMLNGSSLYGSKMGNALGVLAVMYSSVEAASDQLELDKYVGHDSASPFIAAVTTGILYKSTAQGGPKVMVLAGGLGGAVLLAYMAGSKYLPTNYVREIFF